LERLVSVVTTGTYLALIREEDPDIGSAAVTAGRAAVDARLGWLEPPRRIVVSTMGVGVELPEELRPELRDALRSKERAGWEVHVRDDVPPGLRLDAADPAPAGYWALLDDGEQRYDVAGHETPDAAAEAVLLPVEQGPR
jgi:hypothetical protein